MSTSMWDQSCKLVPDQNICQVFEQALTANDDYYRLLKISEGIKYITQKLPTATTFSSSKILFQLMCLYPFQKNNIEQLISAFFEYFQDFRFINSYYEAASNISALQETTTQTLKQRIAVMQRIPIKQNNSNSEGQQFSQAINQEVITIKLFCLNYLKKFFILANEQQLDFQLYCFLFKHYIQNTTNQQIFQIIMDCFSELRFTIFTQCEWINQFSEEILLFFKNSPKLFVSYTKYSNIVVMEEDSVEDIVSQTQIQIQQPQNNKRRSYLTSDQDPSLYLQNLCCKQEVDQPLQQNSVFEEIDNIDILLQFVIDPIQVQISYLWNEAFPNLPEIIDVEKNIFKQKSEQQLNKYQVYRSYKTLQILTNQENFKNLLGINAQIFAKIFYFININLYDDKKNINLHHAAILIKFVMYLQPKFCIKQIIEQKLFPKLLEFAYNPSINQLLQDIICFYDDTMKLGVYYLEQLWNYLYQTQFLQLLRLYVQNQQETFELKTEQTPKNNDVIQVLKALSIFDAQKLQQRLFRQKTEEVVDPNSILRRNDYDNLEQFEKEELIKKQKIERHMNRQSSISHQLQDRKVHQLQKRASNNNFFLPKIATNIETDQKIINISQSTENKLFNPKTSPIIRKRNQYSSHQIKNKLKTEQDNELYSNDGFSSSRLALIYPTTKSTIFISDFEKNKPQYNKISISENHLILLIQLINQALLFAEEQENLQKRLPKTQIFNIERFLKEILNDNNLNLLFKIFLYQILDQNQNSDSIANESGILLNKILIKSRTINLMSEFIDIIKNQFQLSLDYLVKIIVQLNQLKSKLESTQFSFKQYILISILTNGFMLYEKQMYFIKIDKQQKSVFRNLTDTLLHLLIIWFSDSEQNNIYQLMFAQFMAIYFAGAPPPYLFNLVFKLGLVSSLYNAYSKFYQNEIKDTSYVEGIFFYTLIVNYIIRFSIKYRNLIDLESTLGILDSWKQLEVALPFDNKRALGYFESLIKLEQPKLTEKSPLVKGEEKLNKFQKTKTQINNKINTLTQFQKKTSEPESKLNGTQPPKPLQSQKRLN